VGAISLGWRPDGSRIRRKVTGRTKTEVRAKLKKLQAEADAGLKTSASYTLAKAVDDWAAEALDGLAAKTVRSHVDLLRPVAMLIGQVPLRDLTAHDVRRTLNKLAETRSTRTMASTHNVLVRVIRHAEANDHVGRNVASFVKPPQGKTGRPSRAMTAADAAALLAAAQDHPRLGAYVILSLTTGIRTEEARALRWDHVDLEGDPTRRPARPWSRSTTNGFQERSWFMSHYRCYLHCWRSGLACQARSSRVYPAHLASCPGPYLGVNEPGKLAIGKRCAARCAGGDDQTSLPPPYGRRVCACEILVGEAR